MSAHPIRVLWTAPRAVSTAFERMMIERGDHTVFDEPFSRHYYYGPERVSRRYTETLANSRPDEIIAELGAAAEQRPVFVKDMAYHVVGFADAGFMGGFVNAFLIRDPAHALTSLAAKWPDFSDDESGYAALARLVELVEAAGQDPLIIDSDDLCRDPATIVRRYCDAVGIPFVPDALTWEPGLRPEWELWPDWYEATARSTGFHPPHQGGPPPRDDPRVQQAYDACAPIYEALRARAERAGSGCLPDSRPVGLVTFCDRPYGGSDGVVAGGYGQGEPMTFEQATTSSGFEPPGPGSWTQDPVHFPRPMTRYWTEMHPEPFRRGTSEFTNYYGMLLDRIEAQYVNGFAYSTRVPVADDEVPRRFQRADEVFENKLWRAQLREWDETAKPASIKTHRELQAVEPDALSDTDLVAYLTRCREHHQQMIYQHMRFTGAAILPIGDLLAHLEDWTAVSPADALSMMRGAAPVSAGASDELERLIAVVTKDDAARQLLESDGEPAQVLDALRALDSDVGPALSAYLDLVGYRLLDGFDIAGRYALELPDALVRAIRMSVAGRGDEVFDVEGRIVEIREQVPDQHRAEFDDLLEEARLMYRLRDERGVFSDIWASGLMRRAVLSAGRRLAAKGRVEDAEHFVDAGFDEMGSMVSDAGGPSAQELAERFEYRTSRTAKDAPPVLGEAPSPPPDPSGLPPNEARVMRATGIAMGALFGSSEAPHEENVLRGLAASGGVYEGPARRVAGPSEFDRIVQGDVLVTESTTEAFNILLPLLGAIVTDAGGLLSHSAIVAREYGIPGVVGTRDATDRIPDGTLVRVDGDAGEVTVPG